MKMEVNRLKVLIDRKQDYGPSLFHTMNSRRHDFEV